MDTPIERARTAVASAKARHGLTEAKLRELQLGERTYKVSDGGNGLYVVVEAVKKPPHPTWMPLT
ncbi:MAG: hypothetical protein WEK74_07545 [Hydrogenophaga sp.]